MLLTMTLEMCSYVQLVLGLARRKGYTCDISEPQLVNGSATPPPNKHYPGLVCYMVTVAVNNVEYHGYGPSVGLARQFASFEAYKALSDLLRQEVVTLPQSDVNEDAETESVSSLDAVSICSEPIHMSNTNDDTLSHGDEGGDVNDCQERHSDQRKCHFGMCLEQFDETEEKNAKPASSINIDNPVGLLQEVLMKEFQTLPTFAESVQVNGKETEFVCSIKIRDLFARGIGQSKKLARRHASENLLALMESNGIDVSPSSKKRKATGASPRRQLGQRHRPRRNSASCSSLSPDVHKGPHHIPTASLKSQRHSSQMESHPLSNPPIRSLLPYPPMHRSLSLPLPQPPHVPICEIMYRNVSNSDSDDSECDRVSAGLCEVVPPELQNSAHHGDRPSTSSSLFESPEKEPSREEVESTKACASSYKLQPSVTSESSVLNLDETFSDITPPFAAHSDPFQFTVRLPHPVESPWCTPVNDNTATKSPPWNEIRCNSQRVPPSTDYVYHQKLQSRRRLSPQKPMERVQQEEEEIPRHPVVDGEEVRCISLPVHPLFLSVPMVQQPLCHESVYQPGQGDYTVLVVDNVVDHGDSDDDVVLTNNISVGLPSEGSVSSLLMPLTTLHMQ